MQADEACVRERPKESVPASMTIGGAGGVQELQSCASAAFACFLGRTWTHKETNSWSTWSCNVELGCGLASDCQRECLQATRSDRDLASIRIWTSRIDFGWTRSNGMSQSALSVRSPFLLARRSLPLSLPARSRRCPTQGTWWPLEVMATVLLTFFSSPQGPYRKSLAIKHLDGEPLTRKDIQYDLLYYLFSNTEAVFTDPHPTVHGGLAGTKVTFRDLYVNSLAHSSKCSKVTRDKLLDTPDFGVEFSKISLLSNVGRINTTMACASVSYATTIVQSLMISVVFPEMRTALRTYHPVPSLQKTDGNLQDAPRIKNILKSCFTPSERANPPLTPADVLARSVRHPPGHVFMRIKFFHRDPAKSQPQALLI